MHPERVVIARVSAVVAATVAITIVVAAVVVAAAIGALGTSSKMYKLLSSLPTAAQNLELRSSE
jgi:predicted permease